MQPEITATPAKRMQKKYYIYKNIVIPRKMKHATSTYAPSEFINLKGIEYFRFEEDFVHDNVRCIPMIVRFKMDAAGIKLKLSEWSKFGVRERVQLAVRPCSTYADVSLYKSYLIHLIRKYTDGEGTPMEIDSNPPWASHQPIPEQLAQRLEREEQSVSAFQWQTLTNLQRFALLKLCREGHESKNFIKALKEFHVIE